MVCGIYKWLEESIKEYYHPVRVLKRNETKEIVLYQHKESGKTVVVKYLKGIYEVYKKLVELEHDNLVRVIEAVSDDNRTMVIEEYLEGISVADVLEINRFSQKEMCRIVTQLCDGLDVLHKKQIIHRDIKPENVFLLSDGGVKIIDFDASRIYREHVSKDTVVLGTVGYAAPEQYGDAQTDERSDIYALGILMNVMLTGRHPVDTVVSGKIGNIIETCIMVNPNKRYRNVLEVQKQLKKMVY